MARKVKSSTPAQSNGVQVNHRSTEPKKHYSQGLNYFDNSYSQAFSQRFADIHPFCVLDAIERDDIPFRSSHELGTYTLQSPLKSELFMHKTVALVPFQSILPNTWKLFYVNPTKGEDVPDDVYCNISTKSLFESVFNTIVQKLSSVVPLASPASLPTLVECLLLLESIFSKGSLPTALKLSLHPFWNTVSYLSESFSEEFNTSDFDSFLDIILSEVFKNTGLSLYRSYGDDDIDRIATVMNYNEGSPLYRRVSPHLILDVIRERDYTSISTGIGEDGSFLDPNDFQWFGESYPDFLSRFIHLFQNVIDNIDLFHDYRISLERPIAYQLACVKFMSDDSIDNVYTANIFRNNFTALFQYGDMFQLNGQPIIYDVFSEHNLLKALESNTELFCSLLFSYRHSLKYGDYFISARPTPYALGDVNAPVVNNFVSAIDITKKISEQRFVNWSNRTGMSYEDYVEGLTGVRPSLDITEPLFVSHEQFQIFGMEVENTGAAQQEAGTNSVSTLLKSNVSKFMYNIGITDPCVLIGLSHFDVKRLYTRIMDRANLKSNRFDFFNKFYQYTGDQEIKQIEIDSNSPEKSNFAYTTRYMQYKQQVSHAGGAFLGPLRSWAMVADADDDKYNFLRINSDFIRNANSSFDVFYGSLTAYSLGNYFHFAVVYHNDFSNMRRAMDVAPDIL